LENHRKPNWWKRSIRSYWLLFIIVPFIVILAVYGLLIYLDLAKLEDFLIYVIVTAIAIPIVYYIHTIRSPNVWKAFWVLFGVGVIGFLLLIALGILLEPTLDPIIGVLPSLLFSLIAAIIIGGFLGNQIGKRRGYRPFG
jgi:hypothetical protein